MNISYRESMKLITPQMREKLRLCILSAFNDYQSMDISLRATLCATTRANFINDRMCHHAKERMSDLDSVKLIYRRRRLHLLIADQIEVKFKKLDHNRRPSNIIPTRETLDFNNQVQLQLPNMPSPITYAVAGYQLNFLQTDIQGIFVVCQRGSHNEWELKIPLSLAPRVAAFVSAEALSPAPGRVRPKKIPVGETLREEANG